MKRFLFAPLLGSLIGVPVHAAPIAMEDQSQLQPAGAHGAAVQFQPPKESELPDNAYGKLVKQGYALFVDTKRLAPQFVGNGLNCSNCHLDQGRLANSAPLWGAYPMYPAYRKRTTRSTPSPSVCRAVSSSA